MRQNILFFFILFLIILKPEISYSQENSCQVKDTVHINGQVWMTRNLDVDVFQNGDTILYAPSLKEWIEAGKKGLPAWCYYNNNPDLGKQRGRLYNWYAASDKRGLAPNGWRIPTYKDFKKLLDIVGFDYYTTSRLASRDWQDVAGKDCYGFHATPDGGRLIFLASVISSSDTIHYNPKTRFGDFGVGYWSSDYSERDESYGYAFLLNIHVEAHIYEAEKVDGWYIRCIMDE